MAGPWAWGAAVALFLTLALFATPGAGVECFVCSYSPRSNTSRLDGCTNANFSEERTTSRACALGCESVASYDLNDELESFHRNCAANDTIITNTCEIYTNIILTREVCSCDWSYCNTGSGGSRLCPAGVAGPLLLLAATSLLLQGRRPV